MRKAKPKKRIILPDPKFNEILVTKFVNNMMLSGKKTTAYKIFYEAMAIVAAKTSEDPIEVWKDINWHEKPYRFLAQTSRKKYGPKVSWRNSCCLQRRRFCF